MANSHKKYRIGVDVGGTNTDAVILDVTAHSSPNRGVIAHFKTPTTPEVTYGIETAVRTVLEHGNIPFSEIACVTVGTTHFINALLERDTRRLRKVAILRLSKSFLRGVPPFSEWPHALAELVNGYVGYVDGGIHIDGSEEASVVDAQVIEQCAKISHLKIKAVVVAGVFSPIDEAFCQEYRVRDIVKKELPDADVVCSRDVANIGFMERENAAVLNAAVLVYARKTVRGFRAAVKNLGLNCPLFLTQNDGTLVESGAAAKLPIRTFSSGPTNSMRGAAYLAGITSGGRSTVVIDVGGTTSDLGVLLPSGFPRQAGGYVSVAGVKINYSMPHLRSIGLGGGSIVRHRDSEVDAVDVGPDSVGHYLMTEAMVFGGKTLTATDISVRAKRAVVGEVELVKHLDENLVLGAQARIRMLLERAIDMVKTSPEPLPVLLVGGGSIVVPSALKGASSLVRPPFHDVANAVGAAIAKVGGTVDIVQNTNKQTVTQAVEHVKDLAIRRAVEAGAERKTVQIAEVESIPLQYVANQIRIIVKAVGELDLSILPEQVGQEDDETDEDGTGEKAKDFTIKAPDRPQTDPCVYQPKVVNNEETGNPEWHISETDLQYLADGCYVLGCAGGGSPASTTILLRDQLREGFTMRIIDSSSLTENANIYWGGHMGSPAVSVERLASTETVDAVRVLMEYLREDTFDAVMGLEIGGANGLEPLLLGSSKFFNRPIIDADWMGRAYPTYWQTTLAVHEPGQLVPCAIDSGDGKSILMTRASNDEIVDRALRASCSEMGSRVGMAARPTTTDKVRKHGVMNTCSLAWRIGRCIAIAEATNTLNCVAESIINEVGGENTAKVLFRGKIVAIERRLQKGHSYGEVTVAGISSEEEETPVGRMHAVATKGLLKIPFKNENIYAEHVLEDGSSTILACVPDLISVLDTGSGKALGVPEFKYGLRVIVLGIACSPRWTDTPNGLKIGGPAAFGYDIQYKPMGVYVEPKSVVLEYAH